NALALGKQREAVEIEDGRSDWTSSLRGQHALVPIVDNEKQERCRPPEQCSGTFLAQMASYLSHQRPASAGLWCSRSAHAPTPLRCVRGRNRHELEAQVESSRSFCGVVKFIESGDLVRSLHHWSAERLSRWVVRSNRRKPCGCG